MRGKTPAALFTFASATSFNEAPHLCGERRGGIQIIGPRAVSFNEAPHLCGERLTMRSNTISN